MHEDYDNFEMEYHSNLSLNEQKDMKNYLKSGIIMQICIVVMKMEKKILIIGKSLNVKMLNNI